MNNLISRQAAIQAIHDEWDEVCNYDGSGHEIANYTEEAIDRVPAADNASNALDVLDMHWVPVSERLPEEDCWAGANFQGSDYVLMTVYNAEYEETIIDYGHTVDGSWYSDTMDCFVTSGWEVTAWQPLPDPYKGG